MEKEERGGKWRGKESKEGGKERKKKVVRWREEGLGWEKERGEAMRRRKRRQKMGERVEKQRERERGES